VGPASISFSAGWAPLCMEEAVVGWHFSYPLTSTFTYLYLPNYSPYLWYTQCTLNLRNTNLLNVTTSLISQNPRDRMMFSLLVTLFPFHVVSWVLTIGLHRVPIPMPMPTHTYGFWVGMGAMLLFMGGHGWALVLCIPTSNSKSESNFSDAWNMLTKKRSGMKPATMNDLLFV
jgi:hypothetical protein